MEDRVIRFERGLPGFADEREFLLLEEGEGTPFLTLQSVAHPEIRFIVVSPYLIYRDYEVNLSDEVTDRLGIEQEEDVVILSIVTVRGELREATLNLVAPVVINSRTRRGEQVILEGTPYTTRHPLFPQHTRRKGEADARPEAENQ
ncbi:Flagellar assembly factor FliW [[Clostridium] ultunense Esp]|nr:Flagellar assembly factor FliW [[Clostridium] ultunense Esp]